MSYEAPQHHRPDVTGPDGVRLHVVVAGSGEPVTVFAAGLGGTIPETRTLGSGVAGTRVFFDFRGHGGSGVPADGDWSYAALSRDLRAVADATGATRAVGVSMGAAALLGIIAAQPDRFERNVFFLPAILDRARSDVTTSRLGVVARRIEDGDPGAVAELLAAEVPRELRESPAVASWVRERAAQLSGPGVAGWSAHSPPTARCRTAWCWPRWARRAWSSARSATRRTRRRSPASSRRRCRTPGCTCSTSRAGCGRTGPSCAG